MFDLHDEDLEIHTDPYANAEDAYPTLEFQGHDGLYRHQPQSTCADAIYVQDTVGSVSFHPLRPILLSASGSRHFHPSSENSDLSSSSDDTDDEPDEISPSNISRPRIRSHPVTLDSSIKMWNFDGARLSPLPTDSQIGSNP